ncbi:uncharacterized protein LOC143296154 [Babylonia areolata]|uniref:uncharacterized protein LOC143296154 n=1 Tax=Babylonia areolata TaxID=304850 RepID=UPI003FD2E87D
MPKRRNPFADSASLQLKTHVGVKEVANGIMHDELMKEVYERTQEKLFGAVKRGSDMNANNMQSVMDSSPPALACSADRDHGQMVLDGAGHLLPPSGRMDQQWSCGQFSSWLQSDSTTFRHHSPPASLPATGGQLCLDSNGQLMSPLPSAMDCDTDLPHHLFSQEGRKGRDGGGGPQCWQFLSAKAPASQGAVPAASVKCQACHHMASSVSCHFCERRVCGGCCRQCVVCSHQFCPVCSRLDYDTSVERAFCLSCVG